MSSIDVELSRRLARIESRVVRGFDHLGVDVTTPAPDRPAIKVDHDAGTITIGSLSVTVSELFSAVRPAVKPRYDIIYKAQKLCVLNTTGSTTDYV